MPSPPSGVSITTYNTTIIKLQWEEPDQPNGIILEYQIQYRGYSKSARGMVRENLYVI